MTKIFYPVACNKLTQSVIYGIIFSRAGKNFSSLHIIPFGFVDKQAIFNTFHIPGNGFMGDFISKTIHSIGYLVDILKTTYFCIQIAYDIFKRSDIRYR